MYFNGTKGLTKRINNNIKQKYYQDNEIVNPKNLMFFFLRSKILNYNILI